jgi:hypothetical protein
MTGFRVRNRFKPPVGSSTRGRLYPGDYTAFDGGQAKFFEYVEHFNSKVRRGHICSKIWKENADLDLEGSGKCISCYNIEDGQKHTNFRRLSAFLWLHLDWHYLVPATNEKGEELTYQRDSEYHKSGDTIYNKVWCETTTEELKKMKLSPRDVRRCKKVFGSLKHWSMGTNHMLALSAKAASLENECKCGGDISVLVYECSNPDCGHEVFDLTPDGHCEFTKKEISDIVVRPYTCPECGHDDYLVPVRECDSCKDPDPLSLWDVDLEVGREGENTSSVLVIHKHIYCDVDEEAADLIPKNDILHRVFAGDSLDYQSKALRQPNPWKRERNDTESYEDPKGGEDDDLDADIPF